MIDAEILILDVVAICTALYLLFGTPKKIPNAEELLAMGWSPGRLKAVATAIAFMAALFTAFAANIITGSSIIAVAVAMVTAAWLPNPMLGMFRWAILAGYRPARDKALLSWLRRVRLYVGAGLPINAAVLSAAEQVTDRAFGPCATAISTAVNTSKDPLHAVSLRMVGSKAAPLVGTLAASEKAGAASMGMIDQVLNRSVRILASDRKESILALGRSVATTSTLISLITGGLVMMAVFATIKF